MTENSGGQPVARVECRASNDPFVRKLIVVAMILGAAAWMIEDHYVAGNYWKRDDFNDNLSFLFNHYLPYLLVPLGLLLLGRALFQHSRRLVADEKGIGFAGKEPIAWDRIARIDATLLGPKGLLILHYLQDGQDKVEKTLKLDSYNFRDFRDIVALAERHVPAQKIQR
jgi:hypothetical protein